MDQSPESVGAALIRSEAINTTFTVAATALAQMS